MSATLESTLATQIIPGDPKNIGELFKGIIDRLDILHHPEDLMDLLTQMSYFHAATVLVVGLLCVFHGYSWHKWVVMILGFGIGYMLGQTLAPQMGSSSIIALSIGALCAIIARPMLKPAVALYAGITGAFIGANIWSALDNVPQDMNWAGATMGFIALAMFSIILFKPTIVLFTSVCGAAMVVFGGITLLLNVEQWEPTIRDSLSQHQLVIPLLMAVAAVGGFVLQEGRVMGETKGAAQPG